MCGICGYYRFQGKTYPEHLDKMTNVLRHRGPDAEGYFNDTKCGFGHRRLSIIDLSERANQPMSSLSGRYVIIFNGEVYNHREIGARMKAGRSDFHLKTSSDTEVIVEAFAQYGPDFVQLLNGMFAIAIYDKQQEELYLFRDRMGIKPLFYYWDEDRFWFASELKALKNVPEIELKLREEAIPEFLSYGYIPSPNSIYKNIFKLENGSWMKVSRDGISKQNYWNLAKKLTHNPVTDRDQAMVKLSDLIISSVQYQLKSDVPFGVFLSGGIDSSLVTAQAVGLSTVKVKTFSIGFEENSHNESEYAKAVAKYLGTEHHEFMVSHKMAMNLIDTVFDIYDEPFADSSALPTLLVSKLARDYVTVTLSGEGGDELFLGYGSYRWARRLNNPLVRMNRKALAGILRFGNNRYKRIADMLDFEKDYDLKSHIFSQEQYFFTENEIRQMVRGAGQYHPQLPAWLQEENMQGILSGSELDGVLTIRERNLNAMERQSLFDLQYYLQDDLLTKVDRASMYYSLETRVPYLDHRLVELVLNISPHLRYRNEVSKYILKEILYQYVPRKLFQRPKQGFAIPLNKWLRNELQFLIHENLSDEIIKKFGVVDVELVKKYKSDFLAGADYLYNRIWLLIVLHNWLQKNQSS